MPFFTTSDGTDIHYSDWGTGQPVILSHGWPLSSDAWAVEQKLLADHGYRAIAHDRRGHGRSSRPWQGNDMDTYARDLDEFGEVVRYAAQHGAGRVAKVITAGAVPPVMVKSDTNPEGTPIEAFDDIRANVLKDRSQFFQDLSLPFFGFNREGAAVSQGARDDFWRQGMNAGLTAAYQEELDRDILAFIAG